MGLLEHLKQQLIALRLVKRGARVIVGVSGGVDSMVLLHALHELAADCDLRLYVAHFNHRLRGRNSDADQRLVVATAKGLRLPCDVGAADVRGAATGQGVSVEMAARELRHAFLARCARRRRATLVALAHHADDQVESFFLRLLRGAGGDGLAGMDLVSASPADAGVALVRPLLAIPKAELVEWAASRRVKFREDASNARTEIQRNWVRNELLPLLVKRQPALSRTVLRTMQIAGAEAEFSMRAADEWLARRRRPAFLKLPVAVQRWVVRRQLLRLGIEPDFRLTESLRCAEGKLISVGTGLYVRCGRDGVVQRPEAVTKKGFQSARCVVALNGAERAGEAEFEGGRLRWRVLRMPKGFVLKRKAGWESFDADRIGARLVLRHWQAGDRFQPIGMPSPTKLQDWFTNRKIPASMRRRLLLAETERGELFWVEGERIGEAAKVTARTKRLLEWQWERI